MQQAGDRRRAAAAGAQRRERRRVLAARPATLRSSRARAHRVYAGELGRARVAAGEAEEEARRDTERRIWEAAGRATASPAGGQVATVDYEANRRALVERKADELRRQDDRRWKRRAADTGELGDYHWAATWATAARRQEEERQREQARWAMGCMATAAIAYMLFSIFSLAFSFTTATDDTHVVDALAAAYTAVQDCASCWICPLPC